jgi:hypothetical protein
MFVEKLTYNKLHKVQRDQLAAKEKQLRFIAANVERIIEALNQRVINENAGIDFNRDAINEVFRGCDFHYAVHTIVEDGIKEAS